LYLKSSKSKKDEYTSTKDFLDKAMKAARREIDSPELLVKVINILNDLHGELETAGKNL